MDHPQQERSKATLDRLLDAAQDVLTEVGAERATMAMICKRAGLTTGAVYRRFPGKDALLRHVYASFVDQLRDRNAEMLSRETWATGSLEEIARALIGRLVSQYRAHRGFLRALMRYAESADARFRRKFKEVNDASFDLIVDLLLTHRDQIHHPDPRTAVRLGLSVVTLGAREMILAGEQRVRLSDERLTTELSEVLMAYLAKR